MYSSYSFTYALILINEDKFRCDFLSVSNTELSFKEWPLNKSHIRQNVKSGHRES